jgi:hypothetical protein
MVCFPNKFAFFSMPSVTLILIFIVTVGLVVWSLHSNSQQQQQRPQIIMIPSASTQQPRPEVNVDIRGGDDRYTRSPEAERVWNTPPDYSRIPGHTSGTSFNIPTQGIPESYQSMGIVKTGEGKLLPLYGRRSISSRERYNYYTRTDSYNPIPIPIQMQGRDCQDQVGCPELFNGDRVKLSATNEQGEVTIYRVRDIVR